MFVVQPVDKKPDSTSPSLKSSTDEICELPPHSCVSLYLKGLPHSSKVRKRLGFHDQIAFMPRLALSNLSKLFSCRPFSFLMVSSVHIRIALLVMCAIGKLILSIFEKIIGSAILISTKVDYTQTHWKNYTNPWRNRLLSY